ncbi:hypothetical protein FS749_005096 [Ceratobasidium sp. UAMH 11750]|nr:hypothetical protein FS749_005096 [Ceratobasidium sp. UAMH 11750]
MQQHHLALEWLELGQSILWGQMLQVSTPYDDLYAGKLGMVKELQRVLYQPKFAGTLELVERPSTHDARSLYDNTRKHRLAERRKELLDFARFLPGLEHSIQPPKASKLASLVQDGVAVVVNTYDGHLEPSFDARFDACYGARCDALVIRAGMQGITHIPLVELSVQKAEKAYSDLARCLSPPPPWRGFGKPDVRDPATADIFIMLWNDVAKPVLDHLGITHPLPAGELPHITWCTTSPLSALPLHAAGDYSSPSTMLPNLAISSYTPTISSLNRQTFSPETFSGILAMGGGYSSNGPFKLPGVLTELDRLQQQADSLPFTWLGREDACADTVLKAMAGHSWVHFAGHASRDTVAPTKTMLYLYDKVLELAILPHNRYKGAQLAYLSSCKIGTAYFGSLNDCVPLAIELLMAGYPTVIATMWQISDKDAPLVAEEVYKCLLEGGIPDSRKAARALHRAVAILRERVGVEDFGRWVPYVHLGV